MKTQECDPQRIDRFFAANSATTDPVLASHLDTCETCRTYFDQKAASAADWTEARQMLSPSEFDSASIADYSAGGGTTVLGGANTVSVQEVLYSLAPTDDPHRLGRLGTYEVSGVVGVGGMGVVLKAVDPSLDRVVAIKVMAPQFANNQKARQRFSREARAAAAVLHPNVIPIHAVDDTGKIPYLVMAYIRGDSLQKRLDQQGPLELAEVLRIGSQIAAGLSAAHDQGLVHRDIKPENVLLEGGVERVTITDFGLARAVDDNTVTQAGTIAGTPMYMSPEQARGENVDQSSDLFSLGSLLYALCTGTPPYKADTSYGVMRKIIDEDPLPLRQLHPGTPEWMANVVAKLMAKDKADRFESAAEVHRLLERCLNHIQQPGVVELPDDLRNALAAKHLSDPRPESQNVNAAQQPSDAASSNLKPPRKFLSMKMILALLFCGGTAAMAIAAALAAWMDPNPGFVTSTGDVEEVHAPLSELNSYIVSMMTSPHDLVYLNLGRIGPNKNNLSFMRNADGLELKLSAFPATIFDTRQSQYADKLKNVAESMSLTTEDQSTFRDGKIAGVTISIRFTGDSQTVADSVQKLVEQTFAIDGKSECRYGIQNLPAGSTAQVGVGPKRVSAVEFVKEHGRGERVYFGEVANWIYLIPQERRTESKMRRDEDVWYTNINDLPEGFAAKIRTSFVDQSTATEASKSQPELKPEDQG